MDDSPSDFLKDAHALRPRRLRDAIDSLPALISHVGADERYRFVNRAYSDWFARPVEDIVGTTLAELLGPSAYASVKPWADAALSGRAVRFETLASYAGAGERYIDASYTPSFDKTGAVDGFFALVQDVTERKRTEQALALSEARLGAVLESVTDVFYALDAEERFTLLNGAGERFYGTTQAELLGRRLRDVFPCVSGSTFEPLLEAAMAGGRPPPIEAPCPARADRRVLLRISPLTGGGVAIVFTDVTERWLADQARQASETTAREQLEELEAIYEAAPVGLAFLSTDLRFVRVNRRLAEMNGVSAAEHVNRTVREVVPAVADQVDAILARLRAGEEIVSYEISGETVAQPGEQGAWLEYWTPLRSPDGEVRGLNVVVEEISERKRADARTRLLVDELNHRVKNTLAVVQNLAHQSFRNDQGSAAAREAFEQRLVALAAAHNVLTQRNWECAELREVVATAIGDQEQRVRVDGPTVTVEPNVAVALSLALHELTTNARKYGALSTEAGWVGLNWERRAADEVRLRWREHGGPAVLAPERQGFGTRLLHRAMDGVPKGETTLRFASSGLECDMVFASAAARMPSDG